MRPSANFFAAVDAAHQIRFINDVPSGAACGCFCAACGSPLVARKGLVKAHHFAHEANQERPECLAGALNLLRRLGAEFLRESALRVLPPYRRQVSRRLLSGLATELVEWDAQPVRVEWLDGTQHGMPVARMLLDNELSVDVLITIADDPPAQAHTESSTGLLTFYTYLPEYEVLCSRAGMLGHLRRAGRFVWVYQPDVYGLVSDAVKRLRDRFEWEEAQAEERAKKERELFDRARAAIVPDYMKPSADAAHPAAAPWAAGKKRNGSYFGYRLADGSVWVYFELEGGGYGLRDLRGNHQWPCDLPKSFGQYDPQLDVIVCAAAPVISSSVATRISSQLTDVLQLLGDDWSTTGFFKVS